MIAITILRAIVRAIARRIRRPRPESVDPLKASAQYRESLADAARNGA